jgi:hypothetical protein
MNVWLHPLPMLTSFPPLGRFGRRFSGSSKPPAEPTRGVPRPSRCSFYAH